MTRIRYRTTATVCPLALALMVACASTPGTQAGRTDAPQETVFLLHGMGRTRASMLVLARRFRKAGYRTVNVPYSQTTRSLDTITDRLLKTVEKEAEGRRYHLVGHSLGSIIIRNGFKKGYPPGLGRIVMLAPPNRPPKLAVKLKKNLLYRWIAGDSGQKLSEQRFFETLPIPSVEFGVIAGDRGMRLLSKQPNDGIVLVETTKLEGMKDFAVLRRSHTFLMNARDTFEHCRSFLENGRFP